MLRDAHVTSTLQTCGLGILLPTMVKFRSRGGGVSSGVTFVKESVKFCWI
jgi:hypothetical protein